MKQKNERNLKFKGGSWYYDFSFRGKRYIRLGGSTKQSAKEAMVRLRVELLNKPESEGFAIEAEDPYFADFAKEYVEMYAKGTAKKRSWRRDEFCLSRLKAFFGRRRLSQISLLLIEKYRLERNAQVAPSTVSLEVGCLKTLLRVALDWNKLASFPLKKIVLEKVNNTRNRVLDRDEEARLMEHAVGRLKPMMILALNTGMRRGEILQLRREHVNFQSRIITIPIENSKSKKARPVPMNEVTLDLIRKLAPAAGFIFHKRSGERYSDVSAAFKTACRRALVKNCRFHDLRHTFATRFIEAGGDVVLLSKILGHSTISLTYNRYCHPSNDAMLRAVENMAKKPAQHERTGERLPIYPPASYSKCDN
jgi:integrase